MSDIQKVTISTHNGSAVAREHNIRNPKVVSKESHIDTNRPHESWIDTPVREAYQKLFGKAVKAYNERQVENKRPERQIKNYYDDVCKSAKKHPVYEMIIGIYGKSDIEAKDENGKVLYKKDKDGELVKDDDGNLVPVYEPICSAEKGKEIMHEFVNGWEKRNPNLKIIGAYYHADEEGEPHVHIDYVPVAHGYTRGLETQTGLVKALGEQGFEKKGKATALIQWEQKENAVLTRLCEEAGLSVDHPKRGEKHENTPEFKEKKQRFDELDKGIAEMTSQFHDITGKVKDMEQRKSELIGEIDEVNSKLDTAKQQLSAYNKKIDYIENLFNSAHSEDSTTSMYDYDNRLRDELVDLNNYISSGVTLVTKKVKDNFQERIDKISKTMKKTIKLAYSMNELAFVTVDENDKLRDKLSKITEDLNYSEKRRDTLSDENAEHRAAIKLRERALSEMGVNLDELSQKEQEISDRDEQERSAKKRSRGYER